MFSYFKNQNINDIYNSVDFKIDEFKNVFNKAVKYYESINGKRKRIIPISIQTNVNNIKFTIDVNKFTPVEIILTNIFSKISNNYRVWRHNNFSTKINDSEKLVKTFDYYDYSDGIITLWFSYRDFGREQSLINELSEFIDDCKNKKEHIKSIIPDFTNYMDKQPNKNVDMGKLNRYIDILIKYSDLIDLDKFQNVNIRYKYFGDYGTSGINIGEDINFIKEKLIQAINIAYKYSTDIVDIFPYNLDNLDINNTKTIYSVDFLYFSVMENDNAIAINKYLENSRAEEISAYYASKSSGGYTGD